VGGFIVLEDGRAFALNNWATNVIVQTIADPPHQRGHHALRPSG
jgi:hypothetical protein